MKYVIDHFGEDVHTRVTDEKHFLATMEVSVSPNFFSWIFRFAGKIRIISPSVVRDEYMEMAQKVLKDNRKTGVISEKIPAKSLLFLIFCKNRIGSSRWFRRR